jgi:ribosome-associated translation inhibitor RaiA
MQLSIRARTIEVTDELRELVDRRIQLALDTFKDRAEAVSVYLHDLNGPRRGIDKICQITVRIRGVGDMSVIEKGETVARALSRAANRLKYRVSEAIRRAGEPATHSIRTIPAEV